MISGTIVASGAVLGRCERILPGGGYCSECEIYRRSSYLTSAQEVIIQEKEQKENETWEPQLPRSVK